MKRSRAMFAVGLLGLVTVAHVVLFSPLPLSWRTIAALYIAGFIPGVLFVEWLVGRQAQAWPLAERARYALGTGYTTLVCGTLFASYLPGGLTQRQLLVLFDGLTVVFFALWWQRPHPLRESSSSNTEDPHLRLWLVAAWLSLLLIGGFFRVTDLGYSEFQSDEASPALRAVAVVQGNEEVLFLHKKGPTEILIPAAMLALTGHLTEQSGRLPFALANLLCLAAVFMLGWQLLNRLAGWIAALLLALDGYYIGYAHMLQYQSILFLMTPLVVLLLYRLLKDLNTIHSESVTRNAGLTRHLLLASLFVTTGLLAHYDGILVFLPGLYLLWMLVRRGLPILQLGRALIIPVSVSGLLLSSFYVPFVLHPNFRATYAYYATHVIGTGQFVYNHLGEFANRATLFNTVYVFWLIVGTTSLALALLFWWSKNGWLGRVLSGLVILTSVCAIFVPNRLVVGGIDLLPGLFGLLLLGVWLMPKVKLADRLLWLWFGLPFCQALFLTKQPSAHFHVFTVPWLLITGQMLAWLWQQCRAAVGTRVAVGVGLSVAAFCVVLLGSYEAWFYLDHIEAAQRWPEVARPRWWPLRDSIVGEPIFGTPHVSGWKVIGVLAQEGKLRGSYNTNIRQWASDWYTRGAEYCEDRAAYYLIDLRKRHEEEQQLQAKMKDEYQRFGTIYVRGEPRLEIYQRGAVNTPQQFNAEDYAGQFDTQLSDANFRLGPPTVEPVVTPLDYRLGTQIALVGYRLEQTKVRIGGTILLTLQWRVTSHIAAGYTLFNQVIGPENKMIGQLDTAPSCTAGPTSQWEPGELITGYYQIPIFADATPGSYPLFVGLYQPENGERLPIYAANGEATGDQLLLNQVSIEP